MASDFPLRAKDQCDAGGTIRTSTRTAALTPSDTVSVRDVHAPSWRAEKSQRHSPVGNLVSRREALFKSIGCIYFAHIADFQSAVRRLTPGLGVNSSVSAQWSDRREFITMDQRWRTTCRKVPPA